jgi:4-amino-4-deoxy-L-arabinose transferase-like glycosyltransferase
VPQHLTTRTSDHLSRSEALHRRGVLALGAGAAVAIVAIALTSAKPLFYDEVEYLLGTAALLDRLGPGRAFLLEYAHPAGILFGLMHWVLEPVTGFWPPALRVVNPVLALVMVLVVARLVALARAPHPWTATATLAFIPMMWVLTGLALTEMVGMLFAVLGLWGFVHVAESPADRASRWVVLALSGIAVGLAFFSRPPLFVIAFAPLAYLAGTQRLWKESAVFFAAAAVTVSPVIVVWGGLVPPKVHFFAASAYSPAHTALAMGYAGVTMLLLCPAWFDQSRALLAGAIAAAMVGNMLWPVLELAALTTVANRVLPSALAAVYPRMVGGLCLGIGAVFLWVTVRRLVANRRDAAWMAAAVSMVLILLAVGKITHQFSSRYVGAAAPFMVIAAARYRRFDRLELVGAAVGAALGAASLLSYHWG